MLSFKKLLRGDQISKNDLSKLFFQADIYKDKLARAECCEELIASVWLPSDLD